MLRAAEELHIRVPSDLAVAGFDGLPGSEFFGPGLTTVGSDFQALGRLAVSECLRRLAEPESEPVHTLMPSPLVLRGSTLEPAERHASPSEPGADAPP